jgi:hypothetical protein
MTDVFERLRAANPEPACERPDIADVWRKLEQTKSGPVARVLRGCGWHRSRMVSAVLLALGVIPVVAMVAVVTSAGGGRRAAAGGASLAGFAAPRLHPGQALYTTEIDVESIQWPTDTPVNGGGFIGNSAIPARGLVQYRRDLESWNGYDGMVRTRARPDGPPRFIGGAQDRAEWNAEFQAHKRAWLAGFGPVLVGGTGFDLVDRRLTYAQLLRFPTNPAAVLRIIRAAATPAGADPITVVFALLGGTPLLSSAREAVIRAAEELPGVRYLGPARDPLGRSGVAIGWSATQPPGPGDRWHLSSEIIINPATHALLATQTTVLTNTHISGVGAGMLLGWRAYVSSRVVSRSSVPTLPRGG